MVSVDGSLFIQIANFLFLVWALNIVLYKPIRNILVKRKEKITDFEQGIDTFNKNAKEKDGAFASGIKEARKTGLKKKEIFLQEAADEEKKLVEEINKKAQASLAEARERIVKDVEGVRASLQQELDTFAKAIGEKILGRAV